MRGLLRTIVFAAVFGVMTQASAAVVELFSDNFEGGLGQWGTNAYGQIVDDPTNSSNKVLNFSQVNSSGDIFSSDLIVLTSGQTYTVEFDYLGQSLGDNSSGGFAGLANGTPGSHVWYAGTTASALPGTLSPPAIVLLDDIGWYHVSYTFAAPLGSLSNSVRLMFEDFVSSGGIAGNAYFDNVKLSSVPVPAALPLFGTGLALMGFIGWRRRRSKA